MDEEAIPVSPSFSLPSFFLPSPHDLVLSFPYVFLSPPSSFYPLPTSFYPLPTSIPSFTCPRMQVKDEGFLRDDVTDVSVAVCIVSIFEFVRVLVYT